ncbi:hypothetical protein ACFLS9_00430 [Bacteroidota bacterium]
MNKKRKKRRDKKPKMVKSSNKWKKITFAIVGLLVIIIITLEITSIKFFNSSQSNTSIRSVSLEPDDIEKSIELAAKYLEKATKANGMFEYRINMDPSIQLSEKYNILRHAGSIYAMYMYYKMFPDENIYSAIERAGRYLRDDAILPIQGEDGMSGIWSIPEVNKNSDILQVKLGGVGLGLVALISIENIQPGFTSLSDLRALGRFLVYMQKEDGSFCSKYIPSEGGRQDKWTSLYYPGEAALGLSMLYEKDPSKIWLETAYKTLEYLARIRENETNIPADHWALLATEKILSLKNLNELLMSRTLLIRHAIQICERMLQDQVNDPKRWEYDGGFAEDGRTTPTATRLEGLLAALSFLPPNNSIVEHIESSVDRGMNFILRSQIREGTYVGAIPRAIAPLSGSSSKVKNFNQRATEVRIDYVQHALSAMIQYLKLTK